VRIDVVFFLCVFSCFVFLFSVFLVFLIWAKLPEINKWMDGWVIQHSDCRRSDIWRLLRLCDRKKVTSISSSENEVDATDDSEREVDSYELLRRSWRNADSVGLMLQHKMNSLTDERMIDRICLNETVP